MKWTFSSPCVGVEPPARLPGIDKLIAEASKGELIVYYYGIHWDSALTEAWYPPVQAMFLKKATAEQVIEQIDENLDKFRALKES